MSLADVKGRYSTNNQDNIIKEGMEQLKTDDLVGKDLTINNVDIITKKDGTVLSVFTFKEYPDAFYFGGKVLTELAETIVADAAALLEVKDQGCKIKIFNQNAKNGRTFVNFTFID